MNNLLTILNWFTTKKAYLASYENNENAKKAATKLWTSIDKGDFIPFLAMILLAVLICYLYYIPFNKRSGRHYHPKYWVIFGLIAIISVFAITYVLLAFVVAKNANFDPTFIVKCSLMNTLYGIFFYLVISAIFCKSGKSNAYPVF